jgi:hypothetical protein
MIRGDSKDYNLLDNWVRGLKITSNILSCEIGVREGLGSKIIMDGIRTLATGSFNHIGIDPYGNLKYQHYDNSPAYTADYTNDMRLQLEKDLSDYKEFKLFHMTDKEFMRRYPEYGPFHLVHFDGPHMTRHVLNEALFFAERSEQYTRFIFDDFKGYNMPLISDALGYYGFKEIDKGDNKICLEKSDTVISLPTYRQYWVHTKQYGHDIVIWTDTGKITIKCKWPDMERSNNNRVKRK